jgi:hypothetical protein
MLVSDLLASKARSLAKPRSVPETRPRANNSIAPLSDKAIEAHFENAAKAPSELSLMHLYPIDGAVHQVGQGETAWGYRDATWSIVIAYRFKPRQGGGAHGVGQGILGSRASLYAGRRLYKLHDG